MLIEYILQFIAIYVIVLFLLKFMEETEPLIDPKPTRFPKTTIIVPAYNEEKTLAKTIDSLLNLNYPKDKLEILIVNDGSTDNTLNVAKEYENEKRGVFVIDKENGGKGTAMNLGIEKATGELIASLDADSFADTDSLMNIVGYFDDPAVATVSPIMKVYKPITVIQKLQRIEYLVQLSIRKTLSFFDGIPVTPGPLSVYRASIFKELGGFEEDNITEDIEIALRLQEAHYKLKCAVSAVVYTTSPDTVRALLNQRIRWNRGWIYNVLFRKKGGYIKLMRLRYGDFGIIYTISFFTVFMLVIFFVYTTSKMLINLIQYPPDILFYLNLLNSDSNFALFYMFITPVHIFLLLIIVFTMFWIFFVVKPISKESDVLRYYIGYLILYSPILTIFWLITILYEIRDLIFGKKYKW